MLKYISQIDLEVNKVDILKNIITVVYVINCLVLIVICLMQSKDDEGASGAIVGGSSSSFYEKNKGRTKEGKLKRLTIILGISFAILTIILGILFML
jgi:preprotein translocase subunit SecG